jgi:hypothetical protein
MPPLGSTTAERVSPGGGVLAHIVDVSDPSNLQLVTTYNTPGFSDAVTLRGHHLYVGDSGSLTILDVTGRQVRTLVNRLQSGAEHEVFWDGKNDAGKDVSSGVYFYRLTAGKFSESKKMVMLK